MDECRCVLRRDERVPTIQEPESGFSADSEPGSLLNVDFSHLQSCETKFTLFVGSLD